METFLTVVHIVTTVLLVLFVLIQSGKGAEVSASFGGSSQTIFGSSGGATFFAKFTAALATIFMVTSLLLTLQNSQQRSSVFDDVPLSETTSEAAKAKAEKKDVTDPAPKKDSDKK